MITIHKAVQSCTDEVTYLDKDNSRLHLKAYSEYKKVCRLKLSIQDTDKCSYDTYIESQSHIGPTCFGVIYAVLTI